MGPQTVLPKQCLAWMYDHGAWLVGSGAAWFLSGDASNPPRDLDFLIPPEHWNAVTRTLVGETVQLNSFGGLKVKLGAFEIDVWPDHLENFFDTASSYHKPVQALRVKPFLLLKSVPR